MRDEYLLRKRASTAEGIRLVTCGTQRTQWKPDEPVAFGLA